MARPSPLPATSRARDLSTRKKRSKMWGRAAGGDVAAGVVHGDGDAGRRPGLERVDGDRAPRGRTWRALSIRFPKRRSSWEASPVVRRVWGRCSTSCCSRCRTTGCRRWAMVSSNSARFVGARRGWWDPPWRAGAGLPPGSACGRPRGDVADGVLGVRRGRQHPFHHRLREAVDRGQGRTQLMGGVGHEVAQGAIGLLHLVGHGVEAGPAGRSPPPRAPAPAGGAARGRGAGRLRDGLYGRVMEAASHQATARPPGGPGPRRRPARGQLGPGGGEAVLWDGQHQAQGARLPAPVQEAGAPPVARWRGLAPGLPGPPGAGRAPAASRGAGPREGAGDQQVAPAGLP